MKIVKKGVFLIAVLLFCSIVQGGCNYTVNVDEDEVKVERTTLDLVTNNEGDKNIILSSNGKDKVKEERKTIMDLVTNVEDDENNTLRSNDKDTVKLERKTVLDLVTNVEDDENITMLSNDKDKVKGERKTIMDLVTNNEDDENINLTSKRRVYKDEVRLDDDEIQPPSLAKKIHEIQVKIIDDDEQDSKRKPRIYFDDDEKLDTDDDEIPKLMKVKKIKIYKTDDEKILNKLPKKNYEGPFIFEDDENDNSVFNRFPDMSNETRTTEATKPKSSTIEPTPDVNLNMIDVKRNLPQESCNRNLTNLLKSMCEWGYQIKIDDPIKYDKESFCCAAKDYLKCIFSAFENGECFANYDENLLIFILTHGMAQLDCYRYQKVCHRRTLSDNTPVQANHPRYNPYPNIASAVSNYIWLMVPFIINQIFFSTTFLL